MPWVPAMSVLCDIMILARKTENETSERSRTRSVAPVSSKGGICRDGAPGGRVARCKDTKKGNIIIILFQLLRASRNQKRAAQ
jgi:hypothetical protein